MKLQFEANDDKEYQIAEIQQNTVYARKSNASNLTSLYYLIILKDDLKNENT